MISTLLTIDVKRSLLCLAVMACLNTACAADVAQGQEAVAHASRMMSAAQSRIDAAMADAYTNGQNNNNAAMVASASEARANAQAQLNGAINQLANAVATGPQRTLATGSKNDPTGQTINVRDPLTGKQKSVPFKSAFHKAVKGGHDGSVKASGRSEHGTGTGNDNEHDHAMGGHTGAGGGFHY